MILCPSMMCADFGNLKNEIKQLEKAQVDFLHLDIMDGHFVPNLGLGMGTVEYICKHSKIDCDAHLMVSNPIAYIDRLSDYGCKLIYIHPETDNHICRTLLAIKNKGIKTGIVISPQYPLSMFQEYLDLVDYILVMTVNPGFAGQNYLNFVDKKIKDLIDLKKDFNFKIIIDGACSYDVIKEKTKLGVDGYVLGTSVLFNQIDDYNQIINNIKSI